MFTRTLLSVRNATKPLVRYDHHAHGGIPGENLPFQIGNKYRLTALFLTFMGSGLAVPFIMLRHQLKKGSK